MKGCGSPFWECIAILRESNPKEVADYAAIHDLGKQTCICLVLGAIHPQRQQEQDTRRREQTLTDEDTQIWY
jgi:hypothetical protein